MDIIDRANLYPYYGEKELDVTSSIENNSKVDATINTKFKLPSDYFTLKTQAGQDYVDYLFGTVEDVGRSAFCCCLLKHNVVVYNTHWLPKRVS